MYTTQNSYIEVGIANGNCNLITGNTCTGTSYSMFWGDGNLNQPVTYTHLIENLTPDGLTHTYTIDNNGGNDSSWSIFVDNNRVGGSKIQPVASVQPSQGGRDTVGMELADGDFNSSQNSNCPTTEYGCVTDPDESVQSFNFSATSLDSVNGQSYAPVWDPIQGGVPVAVPCSSNSTGYCLNGTSSGPGQWTDNKP